MRGEPSARIVPMTITLLCSSCSLANAAISGAAASNSSHLIPAALPSCTPSCFAARRRQIARRPLGQQAEDADAGQAHAAGALTRDVGAGRGVHPDDLAGGDALADDLGDRLPHRRVVAL